MNPKLVAVAGPLKDSAFELGGAEVSIGRDSSNAVRIADSLLSRRHCAVRRDGERFRLFDLDSMNGTFVNGKPVREHALEHGDQIAVGESCFVFLLREGETTAPRSNPVELSERQMTAASTVRLKVDETLYQQPQDGWPRPPALAEIARDLTLLVKLSTTINSIRETEALQRELLRFVFEVVPAERGAIILAGEGGETVAEFGLERAGESARTVEVSSTVVRQVVGEQSAVLANDIIEGGFSSSGASRRPTRRCSYAASRARARSWPRRPSTRTACGASDRSSPSTARR